MHNHSCGCSEHDSTSSHDSCGCHHDDSCGCGHDHASAQVEPLDSAWSMTPGPAQQETMPPTREFNFSWEGQQIHVYQWGNADGIPVVALHGFMQTGLSWAKVAEALAQDHCVYALDFLGHGKSSKPHDAELYSYEAYAAMVEAFLEQVACCSADGRKRRAHVLAYSMGGRIALALAASSKDLVYSLVLESCNFGPASDEERAQAAERNQTWADMLRNQGMEEFIEYWETLPLFVTQRETGLDEVVRPERLANDAEAMALCLEGAGKHAMPDSSRAFAVIGNTWVPVKYLWGYDDTKSEAVAHRLEHDGIDVTSFGTGHNVHLEAPVLYSSVVQEFLSGIEPKGFN